MTANPQQVIEKAGHLVEHGANVLAALGNLDAEQLLAAMRADKKSEAGHLNFVLLDELGRSRLVSAIPEPAVREALAAVRPAGASAVSK